MTPTKRKASPFSKMEIHTTLVRDPVWSRLPQAARILVQTLLGECGPANRIRLCYSPDLFGRVIFDRIRRRISTLVERTGLSPSTIYRARVALQAEGLLEYQATGRAPFFTLTLPLPRRRPHGASSARSRVSARPIRERTDARSDRASEGFLKRGS